MAEIMSDKELRGALIAFGETNIGPITATTRALYVKKLNHYKARGKAVVKKTTAPVVSKKLLGFSSDESGDEAGNSIPSSRRRGRPSRAAPKEPPPPRAPIPTYDPSPKRKPPASLRRRSVRTSPRLLVDEPDEEESRHEDDEDEASTSYTAAELQSFNMQTSMNTTYTLDDTVDSAPMPSHELFDSSDSDFDLPTPHDHDDDSSSYPRTSTQIDSRGSNHRVSSSPKDHTEKTVPQQTRLRRNQVPVAANHTPHRIAGNLEEDSIKKHGFKTKEEVNSKWAHYISMFLLILAVLFFLSLAFMYVTMKSNVTEESGEGGIKWMICESQISSDSGTLPDCFREAEVDAAKPLIRAMSDLLRYHAGDYECGITEAKNPLMPYADVKQAVQDKFESKEVEEKRAFAVALALISNNPQWKMKLYNSVEDEEEIQPLTANSASVSHMESTSPYMTLSCRLHKSVSHVLNLAIILVCVALVATIVISVLHWRWKKKVAANHTPHRIAGNLEEDSIKKHGFKTKEEVNSKWAHYISMFLLILAVLFFLSLAFMYVTMKSNVTEESGEGGIKWMICESQISSDSGTLPDCFREAEVDAAKPLIRAMSDLLRYHAGDYECGITEAKNPLMPYADVKQAVQDKFESKEVEEKRAFAVALALISNNPQWKMKLYNSVEDEEEIQPLTANSASVSHMESTSPYMTLSCRLHKSVSHVLNLAIILVCVALVATIVISVLHWRWKKKEKETADIYQLVEKIIDILKNHSEAVARQNQQAESGELQLQPYLAIPHVRDMLIAPQDRRRQQALWDKACKFLSANESRVRVETQKIAGEEFAVWRWLQQTHTNGSKVWQGQACGEKEASMILPRRCHTPCLKVRNMFDLDIEYGDDWHVAIQDAILEKCGTNHQIVHMAVDKKSREGCVFLKCGTSEAAGDAFRSLQAWWFDGKLVTVKFLRLERYHERFPDAIHCGNTPLKPSNDSLHSLSQPFHKSIIESS